MVDLTLTNLNQTLEEFFLDDGIESELRAVQHFWGAAPAAAWWSRNFAHKHPDFTYDVVEEKIVKK